MIISGLTLEGEEVDLWRLISLSRWSKAKFKSSCNFEESPYVATRVFSPLVNYENVDIVHVFIEIYRIRLTHIQLKNKLWTTVAFLRCCNLIWGLANNNYNLQFLTDSGNLRLCYIFIPYCTVLLYIVGPFSKLTETSFFCWKYELLQFVWYWITTQ
jgi:hypothetical protein